jgi:transposase
MPGRSRTCPPGRGGAALEALAQLARIDRVNEEIARLSQVIERLLAPYEEQLQQAGSMPGWARHAAQDAVAETGIDMSRFRTGAHLASRAGRTPLDNQSGKRNGRSKSKKGNRYLGGLLAETAVAAGALGFEVTLCRIPEPEPDGTDQTTAA